jgi:SAM-dependent methyltransferase
MKDKKTILNIGSATTSVKNRIDYFKDWIELKGDIFPDYNPDIITDIRTLENVDDESMDAIYASHVIEHCHWHEQPMIFRSILRVLKPTGFAIIEVPDLGAIKEDLLEPIYHLPNGIPITSLDLIYGWRGFFDPALYPKQNIGMMHKIGYNTKLLNAMLTDLDINAVYSSGGGQINCVIWKTEKPEYVKLILNEI